MGVGVGKRGMMDGWTGCGETRRANESLGLLYGDGERSLASEVDRQCGPTGRAYATWNPKEGPTHGSDVSEVGRGWRECASQRHLNTHTQTQVLPSRSLEATTNNVRRPAAEAQNLAPSVAALWTAVEGVSTYTASLHSITIGDVSEHSHLALWVSNGNRGLLFVTALLDQRERAQREAFSFRLKFGASGCRERRERAGTLSRSGTNI